MNAKFRKLPNNPNKWLKERPDKSRSRTFGATLFLISMLPHGFASAQQTSAIPSTDSDLDAIIGYAKRIVQKSLPACYSAKCVKLDCGATGAVFAPLLKTYAILSLMDDPLLRWRANLDEIAVKALLKAGAKQDIADDLRDLQLLQDSIATVAVAASEIASTLDTLRTIKDNFVDWKKLLGRSGDPIDAFPIIKDIKSLVSRVEAISKYNDIGADKLQTLGGKDFIKLSGEIYLRTAEFQRLAKAGELTKQKKWKFGLSLLKDIMDLTLKFDRMRRQSKIFKHISEAMKSFGIADNATANMRRINDRRIKLAGALFELRKAVDGLSVCYRRWCLSAAESGRFQPQSGDVGAIAATSDPETALRANYAKLVTALSELSPVARRYTVVSDYLSVLETRQKRVPYTEKVEARFELRQFQRGDKRFQCVPKDATLRVYPRPYSSSYKPMLELGDAAEVKGEKQFRVQSDLSGNWRSETAQLQLEIVVDEETITLTQKDTPMRGRSRVYKGELKRKLSEPGAYMIVFEDQLGRHHMPANFDVVGQVPVSENMSTLYFRPAEIADISPTLPEEVRTELLTEPYSQAARYKATIVPIIHADNTIRLKIAIYNHGLKYRSPSMKIVEGSLQHKLWHESEFVRVDTSTAATRSRQ